MFDRFTDRARKAMALARKEAQGFRHDSIGAEHVLLGLIAVEDGAAARILKEQGGDASRIRRGIEARITHGSGPAHQGQMPFTPKAKVVLEASLEASDALGHRRIGTEHLLLGLLQVEDAVTSPVLQELGVRPEAVRELAVDLNAAYPPGKGPEGRDWRPPRIRNGLELVDGEGRIRARLDLRPDGSPYLEMLDAAGRPRLVAGLDASGVPSIELLDEEGESRSWRP